MPKPFIKNKDKQVLATFTASYRDRHGRETGVRDEIASEGEEEEEYSGEENFEGEEEYEEYDEDDSEHDEYIQQESAKKEVDDLSTIGFKKDGFDYSRYMRPIGGGVFIPAIWDVNDLKNKKNGIVELVKNSEPAPYMYGLEEISKEYKKDVKDLEVDEDIKQALVVDDEVDDFEELDDDFILQANGGTLDGLQDEVDETINKFNNFKIKNKNYDFSDDENYDDEYYEGEDDDYYDEDDEEYYKTLKNNKNNNNNNNIDGRKVQDEVLEAQFEIALEQYEDEDIGELEPEETLGACNVNNFEDVFDEFIEDYNKNHEPLMVQIQTLKKNNNFISLTEKEKEIILKRDWDKEVLVEVSDNEGEENEEDKWDCETILTTYTNLENHPKLLREEKKIKLSRKTGMPVGVIPTKQKDISDDDDDDDDDGDEDKKTNLGVSRKNETKESKKLRKQQLKDDRKNKRELKKDLKVAFKKEEIKQTSIIKDQKTNSLITVRY
ncbi:hypothetical protein RB653_002371 [Dictyostelium firmibasis]|uniref:Protein LTV1 homolog n=1 Tax=Dictyostelium firmibasis TaxID=79012 RepID=A0AAN7YYN1_9MYCE